MKMTIEFLHIFVKSSQNLCSKNNSDWNKYLDYFINRFCVHLSWLYISQSYNSAIKYTDAHETTQSRYAYNIINVYKNTIGKKRSIKYTHHL